VRRHLVIGAAALSLALAPQAAAGTFAGHNGRIAYVQTVAGRPQVFTMAANGRDRRQVTNLSGGASSPDWTRDGRALAYSVGGSTIEASDPAGGGPHGIAADINALDPTWSPDGGALAVTGVMYTPSGAIEQSSIYVLQADGNGQRTQNKNGQRPRQPDPLQTALGFPGMGQQQRRGGAQGKPKTGTGTGAGMMRRRSRG